MEIRTAIYTDAEEISQLIEPLVTKYILPSCSVQGAEILLKSMRRQSIESYFKSGYQYWLGEVDNRLMAVIGIKENSHLYHLFVADAFQGKGYARQLWHFAKGECLAKGNLGVFTVNSALNAAPVYRKWGFKALSEVRERSGIKDIPMRLQLEL
ncbi:MAG: GNAT family N-acetyltransferase [Pseudomonadales bacterium]|nr:GNAT family N-acetyltransferase [Pseudomonadales bacterium]NRA16912.1 GNAT family N-acetyltransferase [Oceanospirillaceae bacterium]